MRILTTSLFLIVALINLAPSSGALSGAQLESLYGLSFDDPRLLILMRHRAVLLGIIGGLLACAAFYPRLRRVAVVAGLLSMLSFILVVGLVGDPGPRIFRVAAIDAGASLALLVAWLIDRGRMERSGG